MYLRKEGTHRQSSLVGHQRPAAVAPVRIVGATACAVRACELLPSAEEVIGRYLWAGSRRVRSLNCEALWTLLLYQPSTGIQDHLQRMRKFQLQERPSIN